MENIRMRSCGIPAAVMLAIAMVFAVVAMLPGQAYAAKASDIETGDLVEVGNADVVGYTGIPLWRVLDKGEDGSLLLMSDCLWKGNGANAEAGIRFHASENEKPYAWRGTLAETWCNEFEQAVLDDVTGLTVKPTIKTDEEYYYEQTLYAEGQNKTLHFSEAASVLYENRVFFLSAEELVEYLKEPEQRVAYLPGAKDPTQWLLRSTEVSGLSFATEVKMDGELASITAKTPRAARPAFWALFSEDVSFASTVDGSGLKTWTICDDPVQPEPAETSDITAIVKTSCTQYPVVQVPWSSEDYAVDHIPPIYIVKVAPPAISLQIEEPGLVASDPHKLVLSAYVQQDFSNDEGVTFDVQSCTSGGITYHFVPGDLEDDEDEVGICDVIAEWEDSATYFGAISSAIPSATDLYNKLVPFALDPDDPASTEAAIAWVTGAGKEGREGVTDYILVAILDNDAQGTVNHAWGAPTWEWTGSDETGYTAAKASFVCTREDVHKQQVEATISTEEKDDATIYTATAEIDGNLYTDTKTVEKAAETVPVDATVLNEAIKAAEEALESDDAAKYASSEDVARLEKAIAEAKGVAGDSASTQQQVDNAVKALNDAKDAFEGAVEAAKKAAEGGDNPPAPSDNPPAADRSNQIGEDGTALGKGASAEAAEAAILASTAAEGPAGSEFAPLKLLSKKQTKSAVTLKWSKVPGAAKYVVYGAPGGKGKKMAKIAETAKTSQKVSKIAGKKLAKGKYNRFMVVALDKGRNVVSASKVAHVAAKSVKAANPAKVKTKAKKGKVALKKGKSFKLKAKQKAKRGKIRKCRKISYESSDPAVATVSGKGVIKAKAKGKCVVYAYAQDGVFAKIKVTVK